MEPFVLTEQEGRPALFFIRRWMDAYPELTAGFTSRRGGAGAAPFESLNCALHVGDDPQTVIHNREKIGNTLHIPFETWTCAEQVHGSEVLVVTGAQRGRGRLSREDSVGDKDGMVTNEPGVWLTAFFADCVPLYFYDPENKAVGIAHAGWRGTAADIAGAAVRTMAEAFGSEPARLLAAIGPSIGGCCYEVDRTVIDPMERTLARLGMNNPDGRAYRRTENGKFLLDLREINARCLAKAGILPMHIEITHLCTSCDTETFFSHRKERGRTGRMAAWIGLKPEGDDAR